MTSFRHCYNFNKHISDQDSILGLRSASLAVTAIGPLARVNICGIVRAYKNSAPPAVDAGL
jgi:hypothetical protein